MLRATNFFLFTLKLSLLLILILLLGSCDSESKTYELQRKNKEAAESRLVKCVKVRVVDLDIKFLDSEEEQQVLAAMEEEATFEAAKQYCMDKLNHLTSRYYCEKGMKPPSTWTQCDGDLDEDDAALNEALRAGI